MNIIDALMLTIIIKNNRYIFELLHSILAFYIFGNDYSNNNLIKIFIITTFENIRIHIHITQ
jgi:hypothetical protein